MAEDNRKKEKKKKSKLKLRKIHPTNPSEQLTDHLKMIEQHRLHSIKIHLAVLTVRH